MSVASSCTEDEFLQPLARLHGRHAGWETLVTSGGALPAIVAECAIPFTVRRARFTPERAADGAMRVHLTFNNNHANYATTNAREMYQLLAEVV